MSASPSILIVDDEQNITESLKDILTDEGYTVQAAGSGDDALTVLARNHFDLILLDIWLPGRRDGLQTLKEMRKRGINSQVVMISGHGSIDTAVRATKLGAFDFIEKPLSLETVLDVISAALQQRTGAAASEEDGGFPFIARSEVMSQALKTLAKAAKTNDPLTIVGELGAGKEHCAVFVHRKSRRKELPFIRVDCSGLTIPAFERLFGPLKEGPVTAGSAFSRVEGSVYLLNPQELPAALMERLADLVKAAGKRRRKNLAFIAGLRKEPGKPSPSLPAPLDSVFSAESISLPPLRERAEDVPELVKFFLDQAGEDFGKPDISLSDKALKRLTGYAWPQNVRELQATVENMVMSSAGNLLEETDIPFSKAAGRSEGTQKLEKPTATPDRDGQRRQKTIAGSVVVTGLGLHSGQKTGLIISPLPPDSGIIFSDISSGRQVAGTLENVESTAYATELRFGRTAVKTIEHIMATLHMYGITNALLKVNDEIPILDGSARRFCELIEEAGVETQESYMDPIRPDTAIRLDDDNDPERFILIEPSDRLEVEYRMDYPQPVGKMTARFTADGIESFKTEVAPARTFGFVRDIKQFEQAGLAEGGKLNNVILIDDEKIVNTTLRFEDEFARHKVLDILGDFYLLGRPVIARITASRSGHSMNIKALKKLKELIKD